MIEYIPAKMIITRTPYKIDWFGCDYNMNLYKGCSHGCIYCDARSECYGVENFHEVRAKANAVEIIERELKSKRKTGVIGTGAMSDPYNPYEAELKLTRNALCLIDRYRFGISLITKSSMVTRDIDVFKSIAAHSPVCVKLTITTFDDALCAKLEPNVAVSSERFAAIERLAKAGIFTGIMTMPVLPFINDTAENITSIVKKAAASGAKFIYPAFGVTLRTNQRDYFYRQLDRLFPGLKQKYIGMFGNSYECIAPDYQRLWDIFQTLCQKCGILFEMQDIIAAYIKEKKSAQLSLFDSTSVL